MVTQHGTGDFYGRGADVETAAGLDTCQMRVYGARPASGRAMIFAVPPGTLETRVWIDTATVGWTGANWATIDAADLTYSWAEYNRDSFTLTGTSAPASTLDDFVTLKGARRSATR